MRASLGGFGATSAALSVLALVSGCVLAGTSSPASPSCPGAPAPTVTAGLTGSDGPDLVMVGRIITMDDPPIAEALLIEAGLVTCVGTRDEVLALAGDQIPVIDIGQYVAYPGSSMPTPTGSVTATTTAWDQRPKPWRPQLPAAGPPSRSSG
jgi:hypothetical protein